MRKDNRNNVLLIEKLTELNEMEIAKIKVLTAIFMKTLQELNDKKVQSMVSNFEEQAKAYGQHLADYQEIYDKTISQYEAQMTQIMDKYKERFINIQLELQEAECNQKIAIANLKKSFDIKSEAEEASKEKLAQDYLRKMFACMQKKENYDLIIDECEKELENCIEEAENKLNNVFLDKYRWSSIEIDFNKILAIDGSWLFKYVSFFRERFGFLVYPFDLAMNVLNRVKNIRFEEPAFDIPVLKEPFSRSKAY